MPLLRTTQRMLGATRAGVAVGGAPEAAAAADDLLQLEHGDPAPERRAVVQPFDVAWQRTDLDAVHELADGRTGMSSEELTTDAAERPSFEDRQIAVGAIAFECAAHRRSNLLTIIATTTT